MCLSSCFPIAYASIFVSLVAGWIMEIVFTDKLIIICDFSQLISSLVQVKFSQYTASSSELVPSLDALVEQTSQQTSTSGHDPMDADIPVSADGAPEDTLHGSNSELDEKLDVLADGQKVDSSIENHSNGAKEMETSLDDACVAPESNSDQVKMEE